MHYQLPLLLAIASLSYPPGYVQTDSTRIFLVQVLSVRFSFSFYIKSSYLDLPLFVLYGHILSGINHDLQYWGKYIEILQSLVFMITNVMKCSVICSKQNSFLRRFFTKPLTKLTIFIYCGIIIIIPVFQSMMFVTVKSNIPFSFVWFSFSRKNMHHFGLKLEQKVYLIGLFLQNMKIDQNLLYLKIVIHMTSQDFKNMILKISKTLKHCLWGIARILIQILMKTPLRKG